MKKAFALALVLVLALGLAACGSETTVVPTSEAAAATTSTAAEETTDALIPYEVVTEPNFDTAALFERLKGYWTRRYAAFHYGFVGFVYEDGKPCMDSGVFDGEHSGKLQVTGGQNLSENIVALAVFHPAQGEDDMYPGPARTEMYYYDLTDIESGIIKISFWEGRWDTYTYGGTTKKKAGEKAYAVDQSNVTTITENPADATTSRMVAD